MSLSGAQDEYQDEQVHPLLLPLFFSLSYVWTHIIQFFKHLLSTYLRRQY